MESTNESETTRSPIRWNWLCRSIRIIGLLALIDGAFRLTNVLSAHTAGCNHFELRDALELAAAAANLAAGYGTMLLKNWGRVLLIICYSFRVITMSGAYYLVTSNARQDVDVSGWILSSVALSLPLGLLLMLWLGWRKLVSQAPLAKVKVWRNVAAVSVVIGAGMSLITRFDFGEEINERSDLDASCLRHSDYRVFFPSIGFRSRVKQRGWRVSIRQKDGDIELYPLPPGGACIARFNPRTGVLSAHGFAFSGEPYQAAPILTGRKTLRGIYFHRENGPISGAITFGEDALGGLYLFLENFSVYGKSYDGVWYAPANESRQF
ncbi:MAG: hypothetical protein HY043_21670 [Verrucomicrobia bacterium]|nr:hypothetical protein [Verrucomicrobiota bacterium]